VLLLRPVCLHEFPRRCSITVQNMRQGPVLGAFVPATGVLQLFNPSFGPHSLFDFQLFQGLCHILYTTHFMFVAYNNAPAASEPRRGHDTGTASATHSRAADDATAQRSRRSRAGTHDDGLTAVPTAAEAEARHPVRRPACVAFSCAPPAPPLCLLLCVRCGGRPLWQSCVLTARLYGFDPSTQARVFVVSTLAAARLTVTSGAGHDGGSLHGGASSDHSGLRSDGRSAGGGGGGHPAHAVVQEFTLPPGEDVLGIRALLTTQGTVSSASRTVPPRHDGAGSARDDASASSPTGGSKQHATKRRRFFTPMTRRERVQRSAGGASSGGGDGASVGSSDSAGGAGGDSGAAAGSGGGVDGGNDPSVVARFRSRTVLSDDGVEHELAAPPPGVADDSMEMEDPDEEVIDDVSKTGFILWTTKVGGGRVQPRVGSPVQSSPV